MDTTTLGLMVTTEKYKATYHNLPQHHFLSPSLNGKEKESWSPILFKKNT